MTCACYYSGNMWLQAAALVLVAVVAFIANKGLITDGFEMIKNKLVKKK